ncbi:hypothetical protein BXA17_20155, partial [Acinetobacter baumannii]
MVLLEVAEIRTKPVSGAAVLLLREADGRRHLALWMTLALTTLGRDPRPLVDLKATVKHLVKCMFEVGECKRCEAGGVAST